MHQIGFRSSFEILMILSIFEIIITFLNQVMASATVKVRHPNGN